MYKWIDESNSSNSSTDHKWFLSTKTGKYTLTASLSTPPIITWQDYLEILREYLSINIQEVKSKKAKPIEYEFPIQTPDQIKSGTYTKLETFLMEVFKDDNISCIQKIIQMHNYFIKCKTTYTFLKTACDNRLREGYFINKSLTDFSKNIRHIASNSAGNAGGKMIFPYLRNIMKDNWQYFAFKKESLHDRRYGVIAKAIHSIINGINPAEQLINSDIEQTLKSLKWFIFTVIEKEKKREENSKFY